MAANKYVIQKQNDLDCAAVERSLAILRQAKDEVGGWQELTLDPNARAALQDTVNALDDLHSDLRGSTEDMTAKAGEVA